jgi:hypothetical protein
MLSACGGGGDNAAPSSSNPPASSSSPQPQNPVTGVGKGLILATNAVTFSTNNRNYTPPNQFIETTLDYTGSGVPYFKGEITGDAASSTYVELTNRKGRAGFVANNAPYLSPGTHTSTVKISVCIDDPDCTNNRLLGTPQIVNVTYTINTSVQGDTVTPKVVPAVSGPGALGGTLSGTVILRGRGFTPATSVQFGAITAVKVTVISDTEIRADYEFLQAGVYPISINGGAIPFSGKLTAIQAPGFAQATLLYPSKPQEIVGMAYDAERAAVFVAARYSQGAGDQLFKFAYNGTSWNAPVSTTIADIRDVVLSPDGSKLLVATNKSIVELDPGTLASLGTYMPTDTDITSGSVRFHQLASANDGYVVISTSGGPDDGSYIYMYAAADHTFTPTDFAGRDANIAANSNGSYVVVNGATEAFNFAPRLYDPTVQLFRDRKSAQPNRDESKGIRSGRPVVDNTGQRIVFNGSATPIYNSAFNQIGALLGTTRAAAFNFDATITYTLDISDAGVSSIRAFDSSRISLGEYREVATAVPVTLDPGPSAAFMATTPNGTQAFIAGVSGVVVEFLP